VAFTWTNAGYEIVHCALFACRPYVRSDGDRRFISNFNPCVLAHEPFAPGSGVFDLTNPGLEYTPPTLSASTGCPSLGPRRITELAVGCWAYDGTRLIAATPMEVIDLRTDNIFNYQTAFVESCTLESEEKACLMEGSGRLGACSRGHCGELCVVDADCVSSGAIIGSDTLASVDGGGGYTDFLDGGSSAAATPVLGPFCETHGGYVGICTDRADGGLP
jgi:hypothetical protein